jgi:hypothetical protein
MHAIASLLAASHLNDLLREAENERRVALVRSARPTPPSRGSGLGGRLASALGRGTTRTARSTRTGAAGA